MKAKDIFETGIAVPAGGGEQRKNCPPSLKNLEKIRIFQAATRKVENHGCKDRNREIRAHSSLNANV